MFPTRVPRNLAGGTPGNAGKFLNNQPGKNNMMIGVAALMALTGLVYYMGYNDVEKRHDGPAAKKA